MRECVDEARQDEAARSRCEGGSGGGGGGGEAEQRVEAETRAMLSFIKKAKSSGIGATEYDGRCAAVYARYTARLAEQRAVDFDDVIASPRRVCGTCVGASLSLASGGGCVARGGWGGVALARETRRTPGQGDGGAAARGLSRASLRARQVPLRLRRRARTSRVRFRNPRNAALVCWRRFDIE